MPRPPVPVRRGERYGRLVVLADREGDERRVLVSCDCGSPPKRVRVWELRRQKNPLRSCGCYGREVGDANLRPGSSNPGERNGSAKLTARKVRSIRGRLAAGESPGAVRRRYGISRTQIARIARRESWADVA